MFNSESDNREEFLTLDDFDGKIDLEELTMINNHPNGDENVVKDELPKTAQNCRMDLVAEFGELLTGSDENPYDQARRIKQEQVSLGYACRTAKARKRDSIERRWDQYYSR